MLNDYNTHLIMSCEVLHYQYDIPVDVEFSVLGVMAATNYQINECRFELLLRQHFYEKAPISMHASRGSLKLFV